MGEVIFDIKEELKKLPDHPGVYLMHSKDDQIIYVGKAISLKRRVKQYFQPNKKRTAKINQMISKIAYFEYIVTNSELEALVLENNLIKEHRPKYNTLLKDDKSYPFIKVTVNEMYPRILFARQLKRDQAKYFGPFTSASAVKDTIELLRQVFHLRTCNKSLPKEIGVGRPCLYHQIHQCNAPCQGYISPEDYQKNIEQAIDFLNGNYKPVLSTLHEKMMKASEEMEFEEAAKIRDLIISVEHVTSKQRITNTNLNVTDQDVIAYVRREGDAVVTIFFVRDGKILGREHYHMNPSSDESGSEILGNFVKQFYAGTPYIPRDVLLEEEVEDTELLMDWLSEKRGGKVTISTPLKGEKKKLILLAKENAEIIMNRDLEKIKREKERTEGAAKEIAKLLHLPHANRMEAYDISNISGFQAVASMVVFEQGKAKKSEYRKFKLKTVEGPDDYKSMKEVLTRRFTDERFRVKPDLILMDGGKGQVNIALSVMEELGLSIPICGMVKDDHHRTRGLYFNNEEIDFPANKDAFHLVTRIQDEAHRFAITYHQLLRSKEQVHSVLDDIPNIGPSRRRALMKYFKDIHALKEASVEELLKADGMNARSAQSVYEFFRQE